ncbi:MAG: hypothetical protein H0X49_17500 [Acidobacteria bacterium]|jgi:hypothetical protein|nr:hypothetical protein [Acidobacteriota bacterium]HEV8158132.1 hypothetical protein [Pyrinomonadaceae bacterium]
MESAGTQTITRSTEFNSFSSNTSDDSLTQKRLDTLLAVNLEIAREKMLFHSEKERMEAALMKNPLSDKQVFAYFGLLLGIFPPAAIFARFLMNAGNFRGEDFWILGVVAIVNLISAVVGYFSGKVVGKIVGELERLSWSKMLLVLPFIGFLWGALAGGAGGIIIFLFGAVFGAMFGAAVGSLALPAFAIFHRLMKCGDQLELKHFLPLSFGITFIVCAFILGW